MRFMKIIHFADSDHNRWRDGVGRARHATWDMGLLNWP